MVLFIKWNSLARLKFASCFLLALKSQCSITMLYKMKLPFILFIYLFIYLFIWRSFHTISTAWCITGSETIANMNNSTKTSNESTNISTIQNIKYTEYIPNSWRRKTYKLINLSPEDGEIANAHDYRYNYTTYFKKYLVHDRLGIYFLH